MELKDRVIYEFSFEKEALSEGRLTGKGTMIYVKSRKFDNVYEEIVSNPSNFEDIVEVEDDMILLVKGLPIDGEWRKVAVSIERGERGEVVLYYLDGGKL